MSSEPPIPSDTGSGRGVAVAKTIVPTIADYDLIRQIGQGSYGDVWLARGLTGNFRAIKVVYRDRFPDADPFEREFTGLKKIMTAALSEPGQLALLHVGQNASAGYFYYVMELADDVETGRDVNPAKYAPLTLKELRASRGRLPAAECVQIAVELTRALAGLHAHGLVHRDIKPSNVIMVGGVPKLADIGLVASTAEALTYVGTQGFVPPEGPGKPAADVFALGRLLYELATGLDRDDFPRLPPELNQVADRKTLFALNDIILRACEPNAALRYRDAGAMLADLVALQAGRSLRQLRQWRVLRAVAAFVVVAAGVGLWWKTRSVSGAIGPGVTSVAVLPFTNLSGDKEQEYFSDGLTEEVLNALAREHDLRVPGRTSSFSFKGKNLAPSVIADALNVAQLVEGSVRKSGTRVRISVSLTRAADGFSEPLGSFDREVTDIFALQDEVARAVVAKLTGRVPERVVATLTKIPEAYDAYLRGRALQTRSAAGALEAMKFYEKAVALDPSFALAWARLAAARFRPYSGMSDRGPAVVEGARMAIDRALAAQPDLPEALIARSGWRRLVEFDYGAAQRDLDHAASLQPATAELRIAQSLLARDLGNWPEAFRFSREVLDLDPQNGDFINAVGVAMFAPRGEYAVADRLYARAMTIQGPERVVPFRNRVILRAAWRGPEAALRLVERAPVGQAGVDLVRADLLVQLGRLDEARALVETAERRAAGGEADSAGSINGRSDTEISLLLALGFTESAHRRAEEVRADALKQMSQGNRAPLVLTSFVIAEIALGHRESALAALEEWRLEAQKFPSAHRRMFDFGQFAAGLYAHLGKIDEAIAILTESFELGSQPDLQSIRPRLDLSPLRDDPRFQELMLKVRARAAAQPDPEDNPPSARNTAAPTLALPPDDKSLVVLPLENLSSDPENAYFTEGMHAEIIATLSRLADFKVISRNSALAFKGAKTSVAEVAQKLGVAMSSSAPCSGAATGCGFAWNCGARATRRCCGRRRSSASCSRASRCRMKSGRTWRASSRAPATHAKVSRSSDSSSPCPAS